MHQLSLNANLVLKEMLPWIKKKKKFVQLGLIFSFVDSLQLHFTFTKKQKKPPFYNAITQPPYSVQWLWATLQCAYCRIQWAPQGGLNCKWSSIFLDFIISISLPGSKPLFLINSGYFHCSSWSLSITGTKWNTAKTFINKRVFFFEISTGPWPPAHRQPPLVPPLHMTRSD